jgi:hypothetical protein
VSVSCPAYWYSSTNVVIGKYTSVKITTVTYARAHEVVNQVIFNILYTYLWINTNPYKS